MVHVINDGIPGEGFLVLGQIIIGEIVLLRCCPAPPGFQKAYHELGRIAPVVHAVFAQRLGSVGLHVFL